MLLVCIPFVRRLVLFVDEADVFLGKRSKVFE